MIQSLVLNEWEELKMYIVIDNFNDLEDNRHKYVVDDIYPYEKRDVSQERIEELSTVNNKLKRALIKEVSLDEMSVEQLVSYAKREKIDLVQVILDELKQDTDNNDDSLKELEHLRKIAKKMKIEFSDETGIEELKELIESKENKK